MDKVSAILGIFAILGFCVLISKDRRKINYRLCLTGMGLLFALAFLILRVEFVREIFNLMGNGVQRLLDGAKEGAAFVVGEELAKTKFIFAVAISASIIFVGALTSLAYHYGLLQRVVRVLAFLLRRSMGVSGPEGLSAGAEAFLGQVESQLLICRYISQLTQSELLSVMATAMATISGSALVAYLALGIDATYLLMASFMTVPAALVVSKIMWPETDLEALNREATLTEERTSVNAIDAIADGAAQGAKVAANVMVQLVAFIALVWIINHALAGVLGYWGLSWTIQDIFGVLFTPIAWLIGVPWDECFVVGKLLATKTILNEYVAYMDVASIMKGDSPLSPRTLMITTVALCGFANFASVGINIGGLSAMAPERKGDIARMGMKALLAATLASWLTGAVAGLMM